MKARAAALPVLLAALLLGLLLCSVILFATACNSSNDSSDETSTTESGDVPSGDIDAVIGQTIKIGKAVVTVRLLDATFNPVTPPQRMSEQTPTAPNGDQAFYQAYVDVQNTGDMPLRVDPEDFACAVGSSVAGVEPTWSGPIARSLLKNSSIEVLVNFKGKAGYQPVLLYSPAWYDGTIRVTEASGPTTTSTTEQ